MKRLARNNFSEQKLSAICSYFNDGNWVESKDQSPEGIRLIQTGNIGYGQYRDKSDSSKYVSESTFKRLKCTEIYPGDLLISRLPEPVGRSCIVPDTGDRMITAVDCSIVRVNTKIVLPEYLNYYTQSTKYLSEVKKRTSGTTRERISRKNLGEILIPITTLEEQKRIVSILDDVFKDAERSQEIAEKNLNNLERLFNSYVLGLIVDDSYKKYSLTDVCEDIFAGGDVPKNRWTKKLTDEYTVPIYTNGEKDNGLYGYTDRARVLKPSITISARGTIGYTQIRNESFYPAIRLIVLIPNPELVEIKYLQYIVRNLNIKYSGSSIPQLTIPMVKNYSVTLPPLTSQRNIIENIEALEEERSHLEKVLRNIKQKNKDLKKSVLNKAFGGEL